VLGWWLFDILKECTSYSLASWVAQDPEINASVLSNHEEITHPHCITTCKAWFLYSCNGNVKQLFLYCEERIYFLLCLVDWFWMEEWNYNNCNIWTSVFMSMQQYYFQNSKGKWEYCSALNVGTESSKMWLFSWQDLPLVVQVSPNSGHSFLCTASLHFHGIHLCLLPIVFKLGLDWRLFATKVVYSLSPLPSDRWRTDHMRLVCVVRCDKTAVMICRKLIINYFIL